ncbi:hypothetical protein [Dialister micraerophilus]|nr:hypothetical protein [Dialister micraerophilus]
MFNISKHSVKQEKKITKDIIPKQKKKKKETTRKTYTRNKASAIDSILGK